MTVPQFRRVPACHIAVSGKWWGCLDRKEQRGQDTSRKVRPVGRGRKSSKNEHRAHLAAHGRKLAVPGTCRKHSGFHTLRRPA
jgi:hypothetical protein